MGRLKKKAPTIFNVYTYDIPSTDSKMFSYAEDICIAAQDKKLETVERTLTLDLLMLEQFFQK